MSTCPIRPPVSGIKLAMATWCALGLHATADQADDTYFTHQLNNWKHLIATVDELLRYVHVSNSATSLWHQAC
ncbi:hypothetical protein WP50_16305, partial [Lactiplantibacillus plantarum]